MIQITFFLGHKPMGVLSKEWFETQGSRFRAAKSVFLYLEISQHIKEGYSLDGFQKDKNIMDNNTLDVISLSVEFNERVNLQGFLIPKLSPLMSCWIRGIHFHCLKICFFCINYSILEHYPFFSTPLPYLTHKNSKLSVLFLC